MPDNPRVYARPVAKSIEGNTSEAVRHYLNNYVATARTSLRFANRDPPYKGKSPDDCRTGFVKDVGALVIEGVPISKGWTKKRLRRLQVSAAATDWNDSEQLGSFYDRWISLVE